MRRILRVVLTVVALVASGLTASTIQATPAHAAAPTLVQYHSVYDQTSGIGLNRTLPSAVTPGNVILVSVTWYDTSNTILPTITDSQGNTYQRVAANRSAESVATFMTRVTSASTLAVNVTYSGATTFRNMAIHEFSGIASVGTVDATSTSNAGGGAGSTVSASTVTTRSDGELVLASWFGPGGMTAGIGFNRITIGGTLMTEYAIQPAAGSITPTAVFNAPNNGRSVVVTLVPEQVDRTTTASVAVDPSFSFTVAGSNGSCNGAAATVLATGQSVPFGRITAGTTQTAVQTLTASTNAVQGYSIGVSGSPTLVSTGGATIPGASPGGSTAPFPALGTAAWGYTASDVGTLAGPKYTSPDASGWLAAYAMGPVNPKVSCVGFRVQAASNTPAGNYSGTIVYNAVPYF